MDGESLYLRLILRDIHGRFYHVSAGPSSFYHITEGVAMPKNQSTRLWEITDFQQRHDPNRPQAASNLILYRNPILAQSMLGAIKTKLSSTDIDYYLTMGDNKT